jgi:DNA-binding NarL/FixJ family response regulator
MMGGTITLVLADDHQVFAEGLGMVLEARDDLQVLGVATDGAEALAMTCRHGPDVLLLDAHMPRTDVADVLREVRQRAPGTRVLVLSADTSDDTVAAVLEAGADGFLPKDTSSPEVIDVIRKLGAGHEGPITAAATPQPTRDPTVELLVRTLSVREREILGYLAAGHSNRRIAEHCFLSLNTVRTHVQNVLVKLGVHSKLEAVAFALEHRVVLPAEAFAPSWSISRRA